MILATHPSYPHARAYVLKLHREPLLTCLARDASKNHRDCKD